MGRPKVGRPRTVNMFWVIVFHHPGAVYEYSIISPRIMKDDDVWNVVQSRKGTPVEVETYCFDNIEDATQVYESFMEEHGRTPLKLKVVDGQVVAEDDEDKKKGKGKGNGNAPRKNGKATLTAKKAKSLHMKKNRDNATFTLDQTYGSGDGDRTLVQEFYARLGKRDRSIPIPPESQIHPQHDAKTQAFIFADYTVRKIVPIRLRNSGREKYAERFEQLDPITDVETARAAARFVGRGPTFPRDYFVHYAIVSAAQAAAYAAAYALDDEFITPDSIAAAVAYAAVNAADLDGDHAAAWKVVNAMLREICGESPRDNGKVTLKSKTKSKLTIKTHDDGHHDHHDHHHHLDLGGSMDHYRDNAGANLRQLSEALGHLSINFPDIMQSIEANLSFSAVSTDSKDMAFIVCTDITSKFLPLFLHIKDNRKAAAAAKKLPAVTSEASLKKCLNGLEKIYSQLSDEMPESWHRGIYSADSERVSYGLDFIRNAHSLLTQVEHLLNTNQDSSLDWFAGKLGGEFIVNGLNSNRKAIHDHPASSVEISTAINSLLARLKGGRDNRSYRDNVTFRDFVYDTDYDRRDPVYNTDYYVGQVPKSSVIVDSFYQSLPGLFGDVHLDIPDPRILVVAEDEDRQAAIFADYALRVFTPMALKLVLKDRAELYTRNLQSYPKITDRNSASKAIDLARMSGFNSTHELMKLVASGDTDHHTLDYIGFYTAQLVRLAYDSSAPDRSRNNTQLFSQVSSMLKEVCGRPGLAKRLPRK